MTEQLRLERDKKYVLNNGEITELMTHLNNPFASEKFAALVNIDGALTELRWDIHGNYRGSIPDDDLLLNVEKVSIDTFVPEERCKCGGATNSQSVQDMKDILRSHPNWKNLPADQRETMEMVVHKFGRILGGHNAPTSDSWLDVQGYVELIRKPIA